MYSIKYYNKRKLLGKAIFPTLIDAEDDYSLSYYYDHATRYEIIDEDTDEVLDEFEIPNNEDLKDDMFDGEESEEDFD